ncbi:molybdate ABC transporter substrate-binding protein [Streptomyces montanisoli]|uniref:Molybdate ABC transporter substrate-binding protein n=1 Tax=Streptomyces montanisoli TaxID=2798581 RepID=A0A940MHH5_9ACTN|nr:molybdate ABC transporter substrate-binding protein [Streptomyces montanisoli]MBP0459301.1 molybdate ABC transporter substrate-binding protein [Streptomyces montanisoli]
MRPATSRRSAAALAVAALVLPLAAACSNGGSGDKAGSASASGAASSSSGKAPAADLTVLAAASLTDVFKTAGDTYMKEHPGTRVKFSFAGSQALVAQVKQGAPADVLVTANTKTMGDAGSDVGAPTIIAKNRLVIVTQKGNPHHVKTLKDLADPKLSVVLAAPAVPAGNYAAQVLKKQHVTVHPKSEEADVRSVLTKVETSADAGIVYKTDAATAPDKVDSIAIPDAQNAVASYPAATLKDSKQSAAAQAFVKWLTTPEAQSILRKAGFQQP